MFWPYYLLVFRIVYFARDFTKRVLNKLFISFIPSTKYALLNLSYLMVKFTKLSSKGTATKNVINESNELSFWRGVGNSVSRFYRLVQNWCFMYAHVWKLTQLSRYSDLRSGDRILVGVRFSYQTRPTLGSTQPPIK